MHRPEFRALTHDLNRPGSPGDVSLLYGIHETRDVTAHGTHHLLDHVYPHTLRLLRKVFSTGDRRWGVPGLTQELLWLTVDWDTLADCETLTDAQRTVVRIARHCAHLEEALVAAAELDPRPPADHRHGWG